VFAIVTTFYVFKSIVTTSVTLNAGCYNTVKDVTGIKKAAKPFQAAAFLVETAGIEPASASTPLQALHA